jgi:hypothetical protein
LQTAWRLASRQISERPTSAKTKLTLIGRITSAPRAAPAEGCGLTFR